FYQRQGLYFNRWNNEPRRYMFDLEYLRGNLQSPNTTAVGDFHVANGFKQLGSTNAFRPTDPTNQDFNPQYTTRALNGKGDQFANAMHGIPADGIRGKFIIENPDSTRFEASVWWFAKVQDHFDPEGFRAFNPNDISTLAPLGAIYYPNPSVPIAPVLPQGGQMQVFDKSYDLFFRSQAYGSDIDWVSTPFFERGSFKLRWMAGVKWVKIREQFLFIGQDSGLSYSVDPTSGQPLTGTIAVVPGVSAYTAALNAASTNTLGGPQIGVRYEIGGEKLKIWGQSRLAIAANNNSVGIGGYNLGDPFSMLQPGGGVGFPTPTPTNPRPTAFGSTQTHTNVSPIFDTQIFAESYVLRYVPLLNKIYIFNRAKFRVGYNFMVVSDVVRPNDSIRWLAPTPVIINKHTNWSFGATSLGLEWKF
ncbi:MAG TPA: hypothetical protein VHB77_01710, partial [Planctomycetaceae bacterium]|nr:hypothetical protein [Planctomycetaceae bacterium]